MTSRITLVIPTMNRQALLWRQLSYYRQEGFAGDILVADSSEQAGFLATSNWMGEFCGHLSVRHYHLPELSFAGAIRELTKEVRTPYVAVIPDDDFLIPSGVAQCADFLDEDNEHIAAHGMGILIASGDGETDCISSVGYYRQPVLSNDLALDRVTNFLRDYSVTLFSTHRTETWARVFEATPSSKDSPLCCDRSFSDELLQCTLTAAYGKIAQIDGFYLVRQAHSSRNFLPAWYQWLTSEKWHPSYLMFRDKVAAAICEVDEIPLQRAQDAVEAGFAEYLQKALAGSKRPEGLVARIRQIAKRHIPEAGMATLRRLRSRFETGSPSLEGMMDSVSPHHLDFLKVYNAVTKKENGPIKLD